jgi:hypothetical protein
MPFSYYKRLPYRFMEWLHITKFILRSLLLFNVFEICKGLFFHCFLSWTIWIRPFIRYYIFKINFNTIYVGLSFLMFLPFISSQWKPTDTDLSNNCVSDGPTQDELCAGRKWMYKLSNILVSKRHSCWIPRSNTPKSDWRKHDCPTVCVTAQQ